MENNTEDEYEDVAKKFNREDILKRALRRFGVICTAGMTTDDKWELVQQLEGVNGAPNMPTRFRIIAAQFCVLADKWAEAHPDSKFGTSYAAALQAFYARIPNEFTDVDKLTVEGAIAHAGDLAKRAHKKQINECGIELRRLNHLIECSQEDIPRWKVRTVEMVKWLIKWGERNV